MSSPKHFKGAVAAMTPSSDEENPPYPVQQGESFAKGHHHEEGEAVAVSVLSSAEPPALWNEIKSKVQNKSRTCSSNGKKPPTPAKRAISLLVGLFPILQWARSYNHQMFRCDLIAGLTIASLGIPQSVGYASLAKLDPQYGLYTSVVPPLIYAVMGSSREIAIGPVAVVSLLISSMVQRVVDPVADPVGYRRMVFTVTFFAGLFQTGFGFFRLGFLIDFLSHAALVGFMAGAAIVIGLQQLKGLLGISHFTNKTDVVSVLTAVSEAIHQPWRPENFIIGCAFLIFILTTRFIGRRNKKLFWLSAIAPLISVVVSTLMVYLTRADNHGVKIIKNVKGGLNPSSLKQLQFDKPIVAEAAKIGLIVAIIALTEAIAVGRSFATVKGYHLDGNKEMLSMGFMNIAGSLSSCYVATGSFSRTAVNFSAGCKTSLSNIIMAITVLLALELLTKLLYYTPTAILASIILSALPGLIDLKEAGKLWRVDKLDFLTCLAAFLGVLFGSVEIGLLAAVAVAFMKIILHAIRPRIEILGKLPGTEIFCSARQYPAAIQVRGLLITRIDSSFLCFTNSSFVRERVLNWVAEELESSVEIPEKRVRAVIIDMSNVMNIDSSGISTLEDIHKDLVSQGLKIVITNPGWQTIHKMKLAKLVERVGSTKFFLTVGEAVEACLTGRIATDTSI